LVSNGYFVFLKEAANKTKGGIVNKLNRAMKMNLALKTNPKI